MEKPIHNYDVSFRNELWATAFSGSFASGTSWGWERVFWWRNSLPKDVGSGLPPDNGNPDFQTHSGEQNAINHLYLGESGTGEAIYAEVKNSTLHHHFKPLSDFLSKPSVQALGLFTEHFTPCTAAVNGIECAYLLNEANDLAVGWVHNRNAYWWNALYINSQNQRYAACTDPSAQSIDLPGFDPATTFFISYFPTRMNTMDCPDDVVAGVSSDANGFVPLNLAAEELNGAFPLATSGAYRNHLDTLHADYAFIIATSLVKSLQVPTALDTIPLETAWDFSIFPNPARDAIFLRLSDNAPMNITILDLAGRRVGSWGSVAGDIQHVPIGNLARGAYWVRVSDGLNSKTKKLLVH